MLSRRNTRGLRKVTKLFAGITVLLALVVFLQLVADNLPPTDVIPLLGILVLWLAQRRGHVISGNEILSEKFGVFFVFYFDQISFPGFHGGRSYYRNACNEAMFFFNILRLSCKNWKKFRKNTRYKARNIAKRGHNILNA